MQLLLRRRQSPQDLNLAALQPLFVMWGWQLQRFPVALEDASRHVRVALRPDIATAVPTAITPQGGRAPVAALLEVSWRKSRQLRGLGELSRAPMQ